MPRPRSESRATSRHPTPAEPPNDHQERIGDPGRLAALRRTALLDSTPEEAFHGLTRIAWRVLGTPVALISLVEDDRRFFKSSNGRTIVESHGGTIVVDERDGGDSAFQIRLPRSPDATESVG